MTEEEYCAQFAVDPVEGKKEYDLGESITVMDCILILGIACVLAGIGMAVRWLATAFWGA